MSGSKVEVAFFTESWIASKNSYRSIGVSGYSVVWNDRAYRHGRGITVYYREHLSCSKVFGTVLTTDSTDKTECWALEFPVDGHKILPMTICNPPENDCSSSLAEKLTVFDVCYENIFLVGDLNTDILRPSSKRTQFEFDSMLRIYSFSSV